jgi:uncharacterized DUF497 family protein
MELDWDEQKRQANINKHGLDFTLVDKADFAAAKLVIDDRYDYEETRYNMYVPIEDRLCVISFTWRNRIFRVISLRKANKREERFYNEQ